MLIQRLLWLGGITLLALGGCSEPEDAPVSDAEMIDSSQTDGGQEDLGLPDSEVDMTIDFAFDVDVGFEVDAEVDAAVDAELDAELDASGPTPCQPALNLEPGEGAARPLDLMTFRPSGGTGSWRFELTENLSGALINETTGAYLAGEIIGVVDEITLTDDNCEGSAVARIRVVPAMVVAPRAAQVERGNAIEFSVTDGSGEFEYELETASGGQLAQNGTYTAGNMLGTDRVRITDVGTGQSVEVLIEVVEDVSIDVSPARVHIPVGSTVPLQITGGTNEYELAFEGDGLQADGAVVTALEAGHYTVRATDRFLGRTARVEVYAEASLQADLSPFGDDHRWFQILNAGDLNGDGLDDFITGSSEADFLAANGGGVFIYHSDGEGGFDTEPVQSIGGVERNDEFGRTIALEDVNGDEIRDLIVGARLADIGATDIGAVYIHLGQPGGLFSEAPVKVLSGVRGGDHAGFAVTVCDFNGDGRMDIATSAILYEDREAEPIRSNQGGVLIFLGYEDGFLDQPDQIVVGREWIGGEWANDGDLRLADFLDSGDIDGDGHCDLVAGASRYNINGRSSAGAVFVYRGRPADALSQGGVTALPERAMGYNSVPNDAAIFGRRFTLGDLNGDTHLDLVVGAYGADHRGSRDSGAVYIFSGADLVEGTAEGLESTDDAVIVIGGTSPNDSSANYDNTGIGVAVADATGDGRVDVLVGTWNRDINGQGSEFGQIDVYAGVEADWPDPSVAVRSVTGAEPRSRFGEAMAAIGDHTGDGIPELVVHSARDNHFHYQAGATFYITSNEVLDPEAPLDPACPAVCDHIFECAQLDPLMLAEAHQGCVTACELRINEYRTCVLELECGAAPEEFNTEVSVCAEEFDGERPQPPFLNALDMPRQVAGARFGSGVALVGDVNGDGHGDAIVASAFATTPGVGLRSGAAWFYPGTPDGLGEAIPIEAFTGQHEFDLMWSAAGIGDFDNDGHDDFALMARDDERYANYQWNAQAQVDYQLPTNECQVSNTAGSTCLSTTNCAQCEDNRECRGGWCQCTRHSSSGAVYIFRGGQGESFDLRPDYVYWMPKTSAHPEVLVGDFDINGDGYDDIIVGSYRWDGSAGNDTGAITVVTGREPGEPGRLLAICDTHFTYEGQNAGDQLGRGVSAMGDVNGDGCDEVAFGAPLEDAEALNNQGVVRILFGWGGQGCLPAERMLRLAAGDVNAQTGFSLASGDADGDAYDDLVVGAIGRRTENVTVGGAWVVPATHLNTLIARSPEQAENRAPDSLQADGTAWLAEGATANSNFGRSVAVSDGRIAIGAIFDVIGGVPTVGSTTIFDVDAQGVGTEPSILFVGETWRPGDRLGEVLGSGPVAGGSGFIVGGFDGNGSGTDNGSVYTIELPPRR